MADLADLLAEAARRSPDQVALVEAGGGRRVTWRELDAAADAVAAGLSGMGLVAGYRVLICLANRVEFVTCYFGVLRSRLVAVPVNPRTATGELARVIADSGSRLVVTGPVTAGTVRSAVAGVADALLAADEELRERAVVPRVVVVDAPTVPGETSYDHLTATPVPEIPVHSDPEALAALLYTSGTSGRPRAAMLTHRALTANIEQVAALEPAMVTEQDVVLGVLPLFHVFGLSAVLGQVVRRGATLVLVDGFDAAEVLDIVVEHAVTVLPVAPRALARLVEVPDLGDRLRGVRLLLSGSAPLDPHLVAAFTAATGIPVHQGYGLTEAAPVVASTLDLTAPRPGSVGRAIPGVTLRLVDEDGRESEGTDPGEIHVCGDNLFSGYWPDGHDGPGADGWFATGDVGFLDADGDLVLVDRLREVVVVSGFSVYPSEVEDVVAEVAGVAEAAVIGADDPETGEAVVAYVRRAPGATPGDDEALVRAVREHAAVRLARFKRPRTVTVVDALPHTVVGKVAKGRLRDTGRRTGPRVVLYTRPGCHLCDDARDVVAAVCAETGEEYDEVDITTAADLERRFGEEVPVTFVDGRQHDFWRVDPARLRAALGRRRDPRRA